MSKIESLSYVDGYMDAVSEFKAQINQSIVKHNGGKSLVDLLGVFNDMVDFTYIQLNKVEQMADEIEKQVGIESVEFDDEDETNPIIAVVNFNTGKVQLHELRESKEE